MFVVHLQCSVVFSKAVQIMQHNRRPFVAELGEGAGEFWEGKTIVGQFWNPGRCALN